MFTTIIVFILILGLLVFVHELGHFITARKTGMKVEEFGIGFPPRMFGVKRGETLYSINWIPLGGFVKIPGESSEITEEDGRNFKDQKIWQQAVVLVAGVSMNIFLAFIVLSIGFMMGLPQVVDDSLAARATVSDEHIQVVNVLEGSPAAQAGITLGDQLLSIDGEQVTSGEFLQEYVAANPTKETVIALEREGEPIEFTVTPATVAGNDNPVIGVSIARTGIVSYPWYLAIWEGAKSTVQLLWRIISLFAILLFNLITQGQLIADISGPLGIAVMTGQVVDLGLSYLLQFIALLSLNLAVINIIPFPALDGGKLLFLAIEKIKGSPVNQKIENMIHNFGFLFLIALILIITYHDFAQFGTGIVGTIKQFF